MVFCNHLFYCLWMLTNIKIAATAMVLRSVGVGMTRRPGFKCLTTNWICQATRIFWDRFSPRSPTGPASSHPLVPDVAPALTGPDRKLLTPGRSGRCS